MITLPATRHDIEELVRRLRPSDRWETAAAAKASGRWSEDWSVANDLHELHARSTIWALWDGPMLVGLGGIAPHPAMPSFGIIWFLGTHLADSRWFGMTRACQRFIAAEKPRWRALGNMIPARLSRRRAWLEKLGFDFSGGEANQEDTGFVAFMSRP